MVELFRGNPEYESDMIIGNQQAVEMAGNSTVLVVVDVNKPSITECPDLLRFCKSVVVLDHHRQGTETIENATLSYVEPYASSACEMVSEILQYTYDNIKIRAEEADCMYSGIMIDYQGKIYISARSIDEINVQVIMERMGGGGHLSTAACQMEGVSIIEAMGALKRTIDSMLENNEL